jgi:hypothetical protein
MLPTANPTRGHVDDTTVEAGRGRQGRRRPSGEPPPLPREDRWTRWIWVLAAVLLLGAGLNALIHTTDVVQRMDEAVLEWFARVRAPALTDAAKLVALLTTFAAVMFLRIATVLVLVLYRRFRHLVVFLVTLVVADWVVVRLLFVELPRPTVPVLVDVDGYAFPSKAISALAITLYAMTFVLVPRGGGRNRLRAGFTAGLVLVVLAELYLAADYLSAMVYAAILAPCVADVAFRWLVPEEGFPITYQTRGSAAHLNLGGERGRAIVRAMADQLGLAVTEVKEFGLEGSGGSSPLRMTLEDGSRVFGKIYSTSHERADRWYRFGRTILYGQLEDETAIGSVRRLAAYEDYALRLLADHEVRVARTYGLVELTPNQEYMLVTEFSRTPGTWATRRSTTRSSTRVLAWCGPSGTSGWPTATSSRPTCSCATGISSWSTSPRSRSALRPGARRSTSPTCCLSWPCGPTPSECMPAPPRCSPPTRSPRPARRRSA